MYRLISQITRASLSNQLVIAGKPSSTNHEIEFLVYDLLTSDTFALSYIGDVYCPAMYSLSISPDAQKMTYDCTGVTVLADYQTGETVAEFEHLLFPQWNADSSAIIAVVYEVDQPTLIQIETLTGNVTASTSLPTRGELLTVP